MAHAAGLGKLTVTSALGQPLEAEIELVSLQPGELEVLSARVATPEAYREARIEYSGALRLLRFAVDKRPNGQPYIKVTSIGPINEPFVDALIEVTWPAGRIQREYPILLDPPGFNSSRVAPQGAAPAPAPQAANTPPAAAPAVAPSAPAGSTPPVASVTTGSPSARAELGSSRPDPAVSGSPAGETYGPVKKGDTLNKIATETKPDGVSLEQMLVALYRENQAAFAGNNMNRLKTGQILKVPTASDVGKIEQKDANKEIRTQVADWKGYRDSVAGGVASIPARTESSSASSGRIGSAAVVPPAPAPSEGKDSLKLSKSDSGKGGAAGKGGGQDRVNSLQEEVIAKDKALKESQSRVADLEKQIRDMQRLLDLKGSAPTKTAEAPKTPDKTAKVEPPKAEPPKVEPPKVEPPKVAEVKPAPSTTTPPVEPPKVVAEAPKAEPPKVEAPKVESKPTPAKDPTKTPKKAAPPPPPPSFMDELIDSPAYLAAGIGGLGIIGLGAYMFMRRRRQRAEGGPISSMTSAFPSDLTPNSVSGKPGGGLVDTGNSSFLTDFDKTGPGTIDTDEVDPVAEAEVYIAYGRDAQAEEILKEAMARDKNRHEISLKLLEIYHARKSATAFETVAKELHAQVGDSHPLWQKAAAMGAQIDAANPLYVAAASGTATFAAMPQAAPAPAKPDLDFDLEATSSGHAATDTSSHAPAPSFDLDLDSKRPEPDLPTDSSPSMDMDLGSASTPAETPKEDKPSFDFDLSGLDFPTSKPGSAASASAGGGLGDLSLDLGGDDAGGSGDDAVGTKLELAKAYLEIGDKDGAREILQEVVKEGSGGQRDEAQKLINGL
ncbi:FimV family protein [Usitatibacter rugosus]|uniref:FimV family protein n=1 Tax=Usitatibacter rugosus TaxID=2732067 RepID=UPI0014891A39|nr:FimV family protein [Usitatibacter rugosus]